MSVRFGLLAPVLDCDEGLTAVSFRAGGGGGLDSESSFSVGFPRWTREVDLIWAKKATGKEQSRSTHRDSLIIDLTSIDHCNS